MKSGTLRNQQQVDKFCSTWATGRQAISDAKVRGLQLERMESGQARWRLRYLTKDGRGRSCITLGDAKIIGLSDARELAEKELLNIAMGNDPKQAKQITKSIPTFATFIEEQYLPYVKSYKRSWVSDVSLLKNHLLPRFGSKYLDEITRQDIVKMHYERKASGAFQRPRRAIRRLAGCSCQWCRRVLQQVCISANISHVVNPLLQYSGSANH